MAAQIPPAALIRPTSDPLLLLEYRNDFNQRVAARANAAGRPIIAADRLAIARELHGERERLLMHYLLGNKLQLL
jgi:hypothetical protein